MVFLIIGAQQFERGRDSSLYSGWKIILNANPLIYTIGLYAPAANINSLPMHRQVQDDIMISFFWGVSPVCARGSSFWWCTRRSSAQRPTYPIVRCALRVRLLLQHTRGEASIARVYSVDFCRANPSLNGIGHIFFPSSYLPLSICSFAFLFFGIRRAPPCVSIDRRMPNKTKEVV